MCIMLYICFFSYSLSLNVIVVLGYPNMLRTLRQNAQRAHIHRVVNRRYRDDKAKLVGAPSAAEEN